MKQNFNHAQTAEEMARLFASDAAHNQLYGGRMTVGRQREVKSVTHEAMEKLHKSLETMPAEADLEDQPKDYITFSFTRQGQSTDLVYSVEVSEDLKEWKKNIAVNQFQ